jgi:branched-chain amino acid transport system substrate-binding protein
MKKLFWVALIVVLAAGLVFSGCAKPAPTAPTAPTAPAAPTGPSEITIGCVACMTGFGAAFGEGTTFGVKTAIEDINKDGGIYVKEYDRKIPVKLVILDCESDDNKTGALAETLVLTDKAVALMCSGPLNFNHGICIVAERYKVPFMEGPGPYEARQGIRASVTPTWQYSWGSSFAIGTPAPEGDYRHGLPGYTMAETYAGSIESFLDKTNRQMALLATDDPDGVGWYESFAPLARQAGVDTYKTDARFGILPGDTTDFSSVIAEWKKADCQLIWSNATAPFFGIFWKQSHTLGYKPKQIFATRSGLFYTDVKAWGGDLPDAVGNEMFWNTGMQNVAGIGGRTPMSLGEAWSTATGQPYTQALGWLYGQFQMLADAIQRAGSLDPEKVNDALRTTDLVTMVGRAQFDKDQFNRIPCAIGQWQKTDKPWVWENPTVFSLNDSLVPTATMIFPIPY